MFLKDGDESLAVRWFQQVDHFVDDHVLDQVLGLFHQLGIESDVSRFVVAASPLGFHPLQEITGGFHLQLGLPLLDEGRHGFVKKRFVPVVNDLGPFGGIAAGANGEGDALMVERNGWLGITVGNGEQVSSAPKGVALPLDEASGSFAGLTPELLLLASNPTEPGDGIGAGNFQTGQAWGIQGDAPIGWVNR